MRARFAFLLATAVLATIVPAHAQKVTEYPLPEGGSASHLAYDGVKDIWYTDANTNAIGRITPAGVIKEFPLPTPDSFPDSIALGPDRALWFFEDGTFKIGRITTTGSITEYPTSATGYWGDLPKIVSGPDNALWFNYATDCDLPHGGCEGYWVGKMTMNGFVTANFKGGACWDMVAAPTKLWVACGLTNVSDNIDSVTTNGVLTEGAALISTPNALAYGPDNALWVLQHNNQISQISRINAKGEIVDNYPIPAGPPYSQSLIAGPHALWFTLPGAVGRMTPAGMVSQIALPEGEQANALAIGSGSTLWYIDNQTKAIGKIDQ